MEMKDLFPGYYRLSKEEFAELWGKCVFILDTNSILNLYRYNEETRQDFINVLRKVESRLWIPHQVALEFLENRNTVINEQEDKLKTIKEIFNQEKSQLKGKLRRFSVNHEDFILKLSKLFDEFLEEIKFLESQQLNLEEQDYIRDIIDDLFKDKIGEPPTEIELEDIEKEGEKRYKIKYPPGFKDEKSKKDKAPYLCNGMSFKREYGDLILWKEILKEVKSSNWTHVIFITDDRKEDWWREEKGKTIGARPELVEEIRKAGASIFYMYTPEHFLKFAKEYIKVDIKEESINQVKNISESKESEKIEKQSNLLTVPSVDYPCPKCGEQASLLMYEGLLAGEPALIYRLQCSNCGYKTFTAQPE
jgi:DNA-directed RNA polymerase subunit M/transcription elongation factor TFIIS